MQKKLLCATACAILGISLLSMDAYAEETTEEAVEQAAEVGAIDASETDDVDVILEAQDEVIVAKTAGESENDGNKYYNINVNGGEWDGTYYKLNGEIVYNAFFCDGTYTYYLQADGTPMKDRLTYHPDKVHVIYFDENGHEVFSNFHQVKKSISGEAVDDLCFFDVYGYMYVDKRTYDQAGVNQYYVNEYGVIERNGWFQYSTKCGKVYGYANADGTYTEEVKNNDGERHVILHKTKDILISESIYYAD